MHGSWARPAATGVLIALLIVTLGLPLDWLWGITVLFAATAAVLRGSADRVIRPISFWTVAPLALCLVLASFVSLVFLVILQLAEKPLTLAYLPLLATALTLYQLFVSNRATWFGLSEAEGRPMGRRSYVLTLAALADGRLPAIVRSGIWRGELLLPAELERTVAESTDVEAQRARDGLALLEQERLPVRRAGPGPDAVRLVRGAAAPGELDIDRLARVCGRIVEIDERSGRPAGEDLAPGQTVRIRVERQGEQSGQGYGHLWDGTPVIIEGAAAHVGERVEVRIRSVQQLSSRGRTVFAEIPSR